MTTAGLLLTGGASTRMGTDKATLAIAGVTMAARLGALLRDGLDGPVLEVGPARSGLEAVADDDPGAGPLMAVATGARALAARGGWDGAAVVLACDLPRLSPAGLALLAGWPGDGAVVPVVDGRRQPLCARWSRQDLAAAVRLAAAGQRSLRGLPGAGPCTVLGPGDWSPAVADEEFIDADSPADLAALGLAARGVAARGVAAGRMGR